MKCSTPFGINELFTNSRWGCLILASSAQRLSASTNCSLAIFFGNVMTPEWCSTPFGINELFTPAARPAMPAASSAQRLSASTNCSQPGHFGRFFGEVVLNAFRHQRTVHQHRIDHQRRHCWVLNAFRHQRTVHSLSPSKWRTVSFVLNAFRHQRTVHLRELRFIGVKSPMCSTPFGINELFTTSVTAPYQRRASAQRLSASTNCSPSTTGSSERSCRMCSTPFGINELFTIRERLLALLGAGAQRLSASTNCSLPASSVFLTMLQVLNAFRHQRTVHVLRRHRQRQANECSTPFGINELFTTIAKDGKTCRLGAQRLSASTNCSLNTIDHSMRRNVVLNAFRHQRTVH